MANAKTLPIDDVLREFRIKALTTPPSAIEMTTLDKVMSQILSKTDIPKEVKIQMYNEALNQFRNVRDTVLQKTPVDLNSHLKAQPAPEENRIKKEWNIQNIPEDLETFLNEFKEHASHVFISDEDKTVFLGNKKLGTTDQMKKAMEYLFSMDPQFLLRKSKNYLSDVKPELLSQVADVAKDVFDDLNVPLRAWKSLFPRIHQITRPGSSSMSPSASTTLTPKKRSNIAGTPSSINEGKKAALKSGIPFKTRMEVSPVQMSPDTIQKPPAGSTRSRMGAVAAASKSINAEKLQKGKGVRNSVAPFRITSPPSPRKAGQKNRYKINFEKWNNQFMSVSDIGRR